MAGLDLISYEVVKYSQHIMLPILKKTFNVILLTGCYPEMWCKGYIVPIFKSGCSRKPSNYRGISIFSCLGKLFNIVLNNRLDNFLTQNDIIDIRQIGFKQKCRTSDHMFILRSLVEKYTKKGKKLFACFIDFKKASDLVDHTYLLFNMQKLVSQEIFKNCLKICI